MLSTPPAFADFKGEAVSQRSPVELHGVYWGYNVRLAGGLSSVLTECPWPEGYDLILGTSERGEHRVDSSEFCLPVFQRVLIVFGGVAGLEDAASSDTALGAAGIAHVSDMFDMYVNTCPFQGSRTIRTEEAIGISLASLQPAIKAAQTG
jgi:predicted SPOUT superfamily RNA methylase MTH1